MPDRHPSAVKQRTLWIVLDLESCGGGAYARAAVCSDERPAHAWGKGTKRGQEKRKPSSVTRRLWPGSNKRHTVGGPLLPLAAKQNVTVRFRTCMFVSPLNDGESHALNDPDGVIDRTRNMTVHSQPLFQTSDRSVVPGLLSSL